MMTSKQWESLRNETSGSLATVIPHDLDRLQYYMSEAIALEY
jgi:hypothetical protein